MPKLNNLFETIEETDTLVSKPSEFLEQQMIDEYYLLARRVGGLSMSIFDFWNTDFDTFYQLLRNELTIIKEEQKEQEKNRLESKSSSKTGKMQPITEDEDTDYISSYESLME